jgi:hypothetical protein
VFPLGEEGDQLFDRLVLRGDPVRQVGAVETGDEDLGGAQPQVIDDIGAHPFGRGGGERHERDLRQQITQFGHLPVFRTEIVAPLGHAVGFVDGDAADIPRPEILLPVVQHQTLRGDIEQPPLIAMQSGQSRTRLGR